jgi:large subunit ribosomal protein L9
MMNTACMQVILLKDVAKVGQRGSVITVADGFALNSLIPRKMAMLATPEALKDLEKKNADNKAHRAAQEKAWDAIFEKMKSFTLMLRANAAPQGQLYKKIGAEEISKLLQEQGVDVPDEAIHPKMAIKQTGVWPVEIKLGDKSATINVEIIAS